MRIDRTHRRWMIGSIAMLVGCGVLYIYDITRGPDALTGRIRGGGAIGLTLGAIGTFCLYFAGVLGFRKQVRTWRIGKAETWMRGHLWLGTLSLPLLWMHGGFRHGGTLTAVLMWLLYAVVVSGLIGAVIQHLLPRRMRTTLANEVTYAEIPRVMSHLAGDAEEVTSCVCGPLNGDDVAAWREHRFAAIAARRDRYLITPGRAEQLKAAVAAAPLAGSTAIKEYYAKVVKPYLDPGGAKGFSMLDDISRAATMFAEQRMRVPAALHWPLDDLQGIVDEHRRLRAEKSMHRWLHGWLFVHVPLAYALMLLSIFHAIYGLRYGVRW